jgi:hypothetical protein
LDRCTCGDGTWSCSRSRPGPLFVALAQGAARSQEQEQGNTPAAAEQAPDDGAKAKAEDPELEALKQEAADGVDGDLVQEMVDSVFSFGELGFQETQTSAY